MKIRLLLYLMAGFFAFSCSHPVQTAQEVMFYKDTTRVGVPFAKDPTVVHFKDRYLMYYSVPPKNWDKQEGWNIGIAESKDMIHWNKIGEMTPAPDAPYEAKGLCAPGSFLRNDTIHLFYQTYGNARQDAICHAYSTDGINFVRDTTNPIFHPEPSDWSCGRAIDAEVFEFNGKYFLYFATRDPEYVIQKLGVATAPAGCDFHHDDWTLAADSSILYPIYPWEGKCIEGASITRQGDKLYMFYAGSYNNAPQQIGVAVSEDGIVWKRLSEEPFLRNGQPGEWNESESGHPGIFTDRDGRTILFYQGNNDKGKTWLLSNVEVFWDNGTPYLK